MGFAEIQKLRSHPRAAESEYGAHMTDRFAIHMNPHHLHIPIPALHDESVSKIQVQNSVPLLWRGCYLPAQLQLHIRPCILGAMSGDSQGPHHPWGSVPEVSWRENTARTGPHRRFSSQQPSPGQRSSAGNYNPHSLPGEQSAYRSWRTAAHAPSWAPWVVWLQGESKAKKRVAQVYSAITLVTTWLQLQLPRFEDENNLGGILQTTLHTKLEGFHTQISKDSPEQGNVAK
ncbi:hypothetical protein QTO34_002135 [Cnephaeus nilssonii]|uniref:Proteasome activator PA28 C-terminal domain-containing protein n=1 Tax=Cnephaeus nilssonii TaxID=3371016 RepID=A0AA40HV68_CNENI|nr:hypothetical protein QTO34_002135 [Eptesicus nilssonii]